MRVLGALLLITLLTLAWMCFAGPAEQARRGPASATSKAAGPDDESPGGEPVLRGAADRHLERLERESARHERELRRRLAEAEERVAERREALAQGADQAATGLAAAEREEGRARFELLIFADHHEGVVASCQPTHSGSVVRVDEADNAYELSLGSRDGVEKDFQYIVSRGEKYVAVLHVYAVEERTSWARSLRALTKRPIKLDDKVMSGH